MTEIGWLSDLAVPGGVIGAGLWLFYRLLIRADRREQSAFTEVKRQRDHYRARSEESERLLADALADLAIYRHEHGPIEMPPGRLEHRRRRNVYPPPTSGEQEST